MRSPNHHLSNRAGPSCTAKTLLICVLCSLEGLAKIPTASAAGLQPITRLKNARLQGLPRLPNRCDIAWPKERAQNTHNRPCRRGRSLAETPVPTEDPRWGPLAGTEQLLIAMQPPVPDALFEEVRQTLEAHGGWLSSYIPDHTALGLGGTGAEVALASLEGVLWVAPFLPEYKLAPEWSKVLAQSETDRSYLGTLQPGRDGEAIIVDIAFPLIHSAGETQEGFPT